MLNHACFTQQESPKDKISRPDTEGQQIVGSKELENNSQKRIVSWNLSKFHQQQNKVKLYFSLR